MAKKPRLKIKMYRHGLGDCHLLRFAKSDTEDTFNILIDCGLISVASNPEETMTKVVKDIQLSCKNKLDIVVMTHEHWDHVSGFSKQQVQSIFDEIDIKEVWYAWTEDPNNELGMRLRKERGESVQALTTATQALAKTGNPLAIERAQNLSAMLGFFGIDHQSNTDKVPIGKTRSAFDYLKNRKAVKTTYCYPEKPPAALSGVDGVRVYVFGPPQNEALIKKSAPSIKDNQVYSMASETNLTTNLMPAFERLKNAKAASDSADCPFDPSFIKDIGHNENLGRLIKTTWDAKGEEYRQIEQDWTQVAETLALNLDTHTNNTCLVLAFELIDTGQVFLFPGDAQVGNWLSWQDLKWAVGNKAENKNTTVIDLLAKTVFYKVGHHGSHNATLKSHGLELMTSEDLIAFIPVNKEQAIKNRWREMPFDPLVKRLQEKTNGRVLQSDCEPSQIDKLKFFESNELYFECCF